MRQIMDDVNDEEIKSPKQKKQRIENEPEQKNEPLTSKFGLFSGFIGGIHGNVQAQTGFTRYSMPNVGLQFAVGSSSNAGVNAGYAGFKEKVGERVMIDMHGVDIMGMQRSMKESAEVSFFNKSAVVKHAFSPSSIPMMLQSILFMNKERLILLNQQDMSADVKAQIYAGLMFDLDAAFQLAICGLTWCKPETVGMVVTRALMLDQHNKDKAKSIKDLLAEGGIYAAIQQSQSRSNTIYGGYKNKKRNKKKEKGVCYDLRDKGFCRYGSDCRYSHDLSEKGDKKDQKK